MKNTKNIAVHDAKSFTDTYMPSDDLKKALKEDMNRYFIIRVEDMYRHVRQSVPASRSITHTCLYITEGTAVMRIGSEEYQVGQHEMLFVPAGQVFSFDPHHHNKGFLFVFEEEMIKMLSLESAAGPFEFLRVWGNPWVKLDAKAGVNAVHILTRLLADYSAHGLKNTSLLRAYLLAFLCEADLAYEPSEDQHLASAGIVRRFRELVHARIRDFRQVHEYAAQLHVSPNHLNKTVKTITGKSPTRWIDETLISEAKILLLQSRMSVNEIARELGMEDPSYFARFFKKYENTTPTSFRKMIEKS